MDKKEEDKDYKGKLIRWIKKKMKREINTMDKKKKRKIIKEN